MVPSGHVCSSLLPSAQTLKTFESDMADHLTPCQALGPNLTPTPAEMRTGPSPWTVDTKPVAPGLQPQKPEGQCPPGNEVCLVGASACATSDPSLESRPFLSLIPCSFPSSTLSQQNRGSTTDPHECT